MSFTAQPSPESITYLTLERQGSTIDKCVALDMGVLTAETPACDGAPAHVPGFAYLYSVCFDRRRLPAFLEFDVPRFQHVTSCKTQAQAYNMLHGRLCHLLCIIMDAACFALEAARCIHHMRRAGYDAECCFTHTKKFLARYPRDAYNKPYLQLLASIRWYYNYIGQRDDFILGDRKSVV